MFRDATILITGATGSFGQALTHRLLAEHEPRAVRLFSRDEFKQSQVAKALGGDDRLRFLIGDVRDRDRLLLASRGVDVIVHAAAMKQVPACEYNPTEALRTNVGGAENVIWAAIANDVPHTIALSTDKAANPVNLYGATKLAAEKLFTQANAYAGESPARFANVRYGNVVGSRGSVVPLFREQARTGVVTLTDPRMTRFFITLEDAVTFVIDSLGRMVGGEVFVPKLPSMRLPELAAAIAPGARQVVTGIRPGEKLHEVLVTEDEARSAVDIGDSFVIVPPGSAERFGGTPCPDGFRYASDVNDEWLGVDDLRALVWGPEVVALPLAS